MLETKQQKVSQAESDEDIILRVRQGEIAAFQFIVSRYERKLSLYLTHLIGNRDEAEDLLQDVFVKAYQHLKNFDDTRIFSPWVYRIAHNEAVNWIRKRSRRPIIVSWDDIVEATGEQQSVESRETLEERWIRRELRDDVREALSRLPEEHREVLTLRYYLDKSYREIAEIIGTPMNTVASRVNRAKKNLLEALSGKISKRKKTPLQ
ncbi:MAG: sigma-70 family RNA polymerase sigma factor [Candidatus Moranbacteria bacterium]|nr:sigma-70 family RNA polymerase sigma factor [Candidatus Moranbacteria bacterium]MBP9801887.1 sigma-70 family RNA polymerase sigma factor [Candidatus Moranbacteria bacterium]